MYRMILYDINDNVLRTKLSKILEQEGLIRVQMSVFVGMVEDTKLAVLESRLQNKIHDKLDKQDKILILDLSFNHLDQAKWVGDKPMEIDEILGKVNELFF
ncbi:MAG: CRISPR-associated endonuclease Cas2 [Saprospiraceae bacterium]